MSKIGFNEFKYTQHGLQLKVIKKPVLTRSTVRSFGKNFHRHPFKYCVSKASNHIHNCQCRTVAHRILQLIALSVAVFLCSYQIFTLTNDYLQYHVTWAFEETSASVIRPPVVSICIDILQLINITKLFEEYPIILNITKQYKNDFFIYRDWTVEDIIRNIDTGRYIIFQHLTVNQIYRTMFSLKDVLERCQYLSQDLKSINCDRSFFSSYIFNLQKCYVFSWSNASMTNGTLSFDYPQYISSRISSQTFTDVRLLTLDMNLTRVRSIQNIGFSAHVYGEYPISKRSSSYLINAGNDKLKVYGLSYSRQVTLSKRWPYTTQCIDYSLRGFQSRDDCLEKCLTSRFILRVRKYPQYSIVKSFDDNKLLHSYNETQLYRKYIQRLNSQCNRACHNRDCHKEAYFINVIYAPKQVNKNLKRIIIHFYPPVKKDVHQTAFPKIPSGIFVGSVGGVFGLWFGLSFYTVLEYVTKATVHGWHVLIEKFNTWKGRPKSLFKSKRKF